MEGRREGTEGGRKEWKEGKKGGREEAMNGRKEIFCLTMHSTHFTVNGIRHMVRDHFDSERRNLLPPPHWILFSISSKGYFRIAHTKAFLHQSLN